MVLFQVLMLDICLKRRVRQKVGVLQVNTHHRQRPPFRLKFRHLVMFCSSWLIVLYSTFEFRDTAKPLSVSGLHSASGQKFVLSFSLYGSSARYLEGALQNAELHKWIFPSWTLRIYHDDTVPEAILASLRGKAELVNMRSSRINPMKWRFLAASDDEVDAFCSRDIDARLSIREFSAVSEWLASEYKVHLIRDHPGHNFFPIMGGLWCAKRGAIPDLRSLINSYPRVKHYDADQEFLQEVVWPLVNHSAMQHVNFGCEHWVESRPIPVPRVGDEHVGAVYIDGMLRKEDTSTLRQAIAAGLECQ